MTSAAYQKSAKLSPTASSKPAMTLRSKRQDDLMRVPGVKQKTLGGFRQFLDFKIP